jgi:hypothetical protein
MNRKKKQIDKIMLQLIDKYGFILYNVDGTETDLMKAIKEIIKLK